MRNGHAGVAVSAAPVRSWRGGRRARLVVEGAAFEATSGEPAMGREISFNSALATLGEYLLRRVPAPYVRNAVAGLERRGLLPSGRLGAGVGPDGEALSAAIPQRWAVNRPLYEKRGGTLDFDRSLAGFVKDSETNRSDMARFYAFCLMFDQITKEGIAGDVAELGVYRGHTATLLAGFARRSNRRAWLLDTFEGFRDEDFVGVDAAQRVQFTDTSLEAVRAFVGEENTTYVEGFFPETAVHLPADGRYCLVHVDCDLHKPIAAALDYFYPRMTPGGFLVIHDYASLWWPGAEQAVDEFFADKPESVVPMPDISGSVVVRKAKPVP